MRRALILLSLTWATNALSSNFEYVSFFGNNQERTTEELLKMQNKPDTFLEKFYCSVMRDELFAHDVSTNQKKDSLQIIASNGSRFVYKDGELFKVKKRGLKKKNKVSDSFVNDAFNALLKLDTTFYGSQLIDRLEKSPYSLRIKRGGNRFDAKNEGERPGHGLNSGGAIMTFAVKRLQIDGIRFDQWGNGGEVLWNNKTEYEAMEVDGVKRPTPVYIALGHELYHAYDSIRGLLDRRFIKGEGYEFQPVIEYRAVYFENMLRKSFGRLYRQYYSQPSKSVKGSMLDENGNPRWIDSTCLE